MDVYLRVKFEVSSINLTSFREGVILPLSPTSKRTPKTSTQIRVKSNWCYEISNQKKTSALNQRLQFIYKKCYYILRSKEKTDSKNPKVAITNNEELIILSKFGVCNSVQDSPKNKKIVDY